MAVIHGLHGIAAIVLFDRKLLYFLSNKNPPGDAHSRDKKMSLMRPRSARGDVAPKTALPYSSDSWIAWNRCHSFLNKRGTYGIIADTLRFATQLSNVYGNAIRAKLANAQTTRSVADSFSSFVTQNLQTICSLYHRHPRFFHKSSESDSIANP